jgi:gluconolactonase
MGVWHLYKHSSILSRRGFAKGLASLAVGVGAASSGAPADNKTKPGSSAPGPEARKGKGGGMKPLMHRDTMEPYDLSEIVYIQGVDHNESLSVGPRGEAYTCGFNTGRVFRLNLDTNTGQAFASSGGRRVLGQAVDADGNLYCAEPESPGSKINRVTPDGKTSVYCRGPRGGSFMSANTPAFDRHGNMYLSDTGSWSQTIDGHIYKIPPGGEAAQLWYPQPVDTPNGIAIDGDEKFIYFVETWGNSIARIPIKKDGSAGGFERVVHMPKHVPDGIAFDDEGRLWIACDRPDAIYVYNIGTRRLEVFVEDWQGGGIRGADHLAFAGPQRDILLASSVDRPRVHRFNHPGARGLKLNNPKL